MLMRGGARKRQRHKAGRCTSRCQSESLVPGQHPPPDAAGVRPCQSGFALCPIKHQAAGLWRSCKRHLMRFTEASQATAGCTPKQTGQTPPPMALQPLYTHSCAPIRTGQRDQPPLAPLNLPPTFAGNQVRCRSMTEAPPAFCSPSGCRGATQTAVDASLSPAHKQGRRQQLGVGPASGGCGRRRGADALQTWLTRTCRHRWPR